MAERTWVRRAGPLATLEQEWMLRYSRHAVECFHDTGFFVVRFDASRIDDGWWYVREPDEAPEASQARLDAYRARTLPFHDRGSSHWVEEIRPRTLANLTAMRRSRPRTDRLPALARHIDVCFDAAAHTSGYLHWAMAAGFHGTFDGGWNQVFAELTGEPEVEAGALLQGLDHASARLRRDLQKMAALRQAASPDFDARFIRFLDTWGRRSGKGYGSADHFTMPTWSIAPQLALAAIDAHARTNLDEAKRRERAIRATRRRLVARHRRRLAADPERLARFDRGYAIAVANATAMEDHNALMEQETEGLLREAIHRAGLALVADGLLDDPLGVHHLTLDEIASPPADARRLVAQRQAEQSEREANPAPPHIGPAPAPPGGIDAARPDVPSEPGVLLGVGGSPGRATGRAVIAAEVQAIPDVEPGDILVARDAGPAWTPIFALLGGLVLDEGAVSQHGAIVAREMGIPAVLATGTATTSIAHGMLITVDGSQGRVELPTL